MPIETRRWFNPSQPQTLQIAVMLLYINGVLGLLLGGFASLFGLVLLVGSIVGAYGIANEQRWGYVVAVAVAAARVVIVVLVAGSLFTLLEPAWILTWLFPVALLALLLHPMSRDYQRIWFR